MLWTGLKKSGKSGMTEDDSEDHGGVGENPTAQKFVTKEYHEGQMAYLNGFGITTNPYLAHDVKEKGGMWYWMFGWLDASKDHIGFLHHKLEIQNDTIMGIVHTLYAWVESEGPQDKKDIN